MFIDLWSWSKAYLLNNRIACQCVVMSSMMYRPDLVSLWLSGVVFQQTGQVEATPAHEPAQVAARRGGWWHPSDPPEQLRDPPVTTLAPHGRWAQRLQGLPPGFRGGERPSLRVLGDLWGDQCHDGRRGLEPGTPWRDGGRAGIHRVVERDGSTVGAQGRLQRVLINPRV